MKFPLSLLRRFLDTAQSATGLARIMTAIGLEVEQVQDPAAALAPFVVAEIVTASPHPQGDKLRVCQVRSAAGDLQIVCGAPNARAGIKVALAPVGAVIPTNGLEIKKSAIRGVESQGMLCSARELGLGEDHAGIIELPAHAAIGDSIVNVLGLDDPIFEVAITANRGDCMGVAGIARDIAAAGGGVFRADTLRAPAAQAVTDPAGSPTITIEDTQGCPAFSALVLRGVRNGASPEWLQRLLDAAGLRPISTLVDITNFFTLAYGRPLHVYDLGKLRGAITVRRARAGETLAALNEKTYALSEECCVIADDSGVIGLGGIMGGASTAVDAHTTDVLLECALFAPLRIAAAGRALQLDSDARARFERGVDPAFLLTGRDLAGAMIVECCGGVAQAPSLVGVVPVERPRVAFDAAAINALGGTEIPAARMREMLEALGFTFNAPGDQVTVPSWRHDISQPADLAEEVLRLAGYDTIPPVHLPKPPASARPALSPEQSRAAKLRRAAAARGLSETYSWGFCSPAQAQAFGGQSEALSLLNPISAELAVMRPSLLPHLLEAVRSNLARGISDIALFELGTVFQGLTPEAQKSELCCVRTGLRPGLPWAAAQAIDLFDAKADAQALLDAAGIDPAKCTVLRAPLPAWFHPGMSGVLALGPKQKLATFGVLHPAVLRTLGIEVPVVAAVLSLSDLPPVRAAKRRALTPSDYPAVRRDFAFVVERTLPAQDLVQVLSKAGAPLLRAITVFDVYEGKGVEPGRKSVALTVTLQSDDRTLSEADITRACEAMITAAATRGAVLRS